MMVGQTNNTVHSNAVKPNETATAAKYECKTGKGNRVRSGNTKQKLVSKQKQARTWHEIGETEGNAEKTVESHRRCGHVASRQSLRPSSWCRFIQRVNLLHLQIPYVNHGLERKSMRPNSKLGFWITLDGGSESQIDETGKTRQ